MHQMNGKAVATLVHLSNSGTGPGAQATTGVGERGNCGEFAEESCATVTMHVTHNKVIVTVDLNMGQHYMAQRVLERRRGNGAGWVLTRGSDRFEADSAWISAELAKLADRLPFPFDLANMLPGRRACPAAVAEAAQEVANG